MEACPICLEEKIRIRLRCGHHFCSQCLMSQQEQELKKQKCMRCALCRRALFFEKRVTTKKQLRQTTPYIIPLDVLHCLLTEYLDLWYDCHEDQIDILLQFLAKHARAIAHCSPIYPRCECDTCQTVEDDHPERFETEPFHSNASCIGFAETPEEIQQNENFHAFLWFTWLKNLRVFGEREVMRKRLFSQLFPFQIL